LECADKRILKISKRIETAKKRRVILIFYLLLSICSGGTPGWEHYGLLATTSTKAGMG
jgi:hypothetical protein